MHGVARTEGARGEASQAEVLERLRDQIRKLQAAPRRYLSVLRTGVSPLDALLPEGGFVLGQAIELCGEAASGRTTLVLRALAAAHRERRLCAYVDGPRELYPPAAAALGVDLARLLWVRPPSPRQAVWAAIQLLRSGVFSGVVLDLNVAGFRLSVTEGKKLTDAAGLGGSALWVLTPSESPGEGMTRFQAHAESQGLGLEVVRGRQGGQGRRALVPWEQLHPGHPGASLPVPEWGPFPSLGAPLPPPARPRRSYDERNGPPGIMGQRPGRDASMPSLRPVLGVGT